MTSPELILSAPSLLDLEVSGEIDAIARTAELLAGSLDVLDQGKFLEAVFERQRINPPVLGSGIALPHARTPLVKEIVCVASRLLDPVAFGPDGVPVRLIFLFGIPPHRISEYLAMTAALVKRLRKPETLDGLLNAGNVGEFVRWLE